MKRLTALAFAIVLTFSLTACGIGASGAPPADSESVGGDSGAASPESEITLAEDTASSAEEAIGVTVAQVRMVRRYSDEFAQRVGPEGIRAIYELYMFDESGELTDAEMWYAFETPEAYQASLDRYIEGNSDYFLRHYSGSGMYYAFYVLAAVRDENNDGVVSWDDAVFNHEHWGSENYILVE